VSKPTHVLLWKNVLPQAAQRGFALATDSEEMAALDA
ncbi:MAG: hypothetical protein ACJAZO_005125, partial [Myxococcota bacterium]